MYGGCGGTGIPGVEASQQGWARPNTVPQWIDDAFHPWSWWESLVGWGAQGAVQPGTTSGWG